MPSREQRRETILALVSEHGIRSQADLQAHLARRGHAVNQGTLSRDLRDLGVRKGPGGYELPENGRGGGPAAELLHAVREGLLDAVAAQNLAVLKTPPGGAQPLGLALDRAEPEGVVGTLAGDDTVLVVCPTARTAGQFCRKILSMRGEGP